MKLVSAALGQKRVALLHFSSLVAPHHRECHATIGTQPEVLHPPRPGTRSLVGTVNWNVKDTSLLEITKMGPADWVRTLCEHERLQKRARARTFLNVPLAGVECSDIEHGFVDAGRIGRQS